MLVISKIPEALDTIMIQYIKKYLLGYNLTLFALMIVNWHKKVFVIQTDIHIMFSVTDSTKICYEKFL